MPKLVQVPNRDLAIEFPDDMSEEDILKVWQSDIAGKEAQLENQKWRGELARMRKGPEYGVGLRALDMAGNLTDAMWGLGISTVAGVAEAIQKKPDSPYGLLSRAFGKDPLKPVIDTLNRARSDLSSVTDVVPDTDQAFLENLAGDVVGGVGSSLAFIGLGGPMRLAGMGSAASIASVGAFAGFNEGFNRAKDAGESEFGSYVSGLFNAGLGLTEAMPVATWLERAATRTGVKQLSNYIKESGEEAIQEMVQSAFSDLYAGLATKEDVNAWESAKDALYNALVGGISGAGMSALTQRGKLNAPPPDPSTMSPRQFREWWITQAKMRLGATEDRIDPSKRTPDGKINPRTRRQLDAVDELLNDIIRRKESGGLDIQQSILRLRDASRKNWTVLNDIFDTAGRRTAKILEPFVREQQAKREQYDKLLSQIDATRRFVDDMLILGVDEVVSRIEMPAAQPVQQAAKPTTTPAAPKAKAAQPKPTVAVTQANVEAVTGELRRVASQLQEHEKNADIRDVRKKVPAKSEKEIQKVQDQIRDLWLALPAEGKEREKGLKQIEKLKDSIEGAALPLDETKILPEDKVNELKARAKELSAQLGDMQASLNASLAATIRPVQPATPEATTPKPVAPTQPAKTTAYQQWLHDVGLALRRVAGEVAHYDPDTAKRDPAVVEIVNPDGSRSFTTGWVTEEERRAMMMKLMVLSGETEATVTVENMLAQRELAESNRPAAGMLRWDTTRQLPETSATTAEQLSQQFLEDALRLNLLRIPVDPQIDVPAEVKANDRHVLAIADELIRLLTQEIDSRTYPPAASAQLARRRDFLSASVNYYRRTSQVSSQEFKDNFMGTLANLLGLTYDPKTGDEQIPIIYKLIKNIQVGDPAGLDQEYIRALEAVPVGSTVMYSDVNGGNPVMRFGVAQDVHIDNGRVRVVVQTAPGTQVSLNYRDIEVIGDELEVFDPIAELNATTDAFVPPHDATYEEFLASLRPHPVTVFDPMLPLNTQGVLQMSGEVINMILETYGQYPGLYRTDSIKKLNNIAKAMQGLASAGDLTLEQLNEYAAALDFQSRTKDAAKLRKDLQLHAEILENERKAAAARVLYKNEVLTAHNNGIKVTEKALKSLAETKPQLAKFIREQQKAVERRAEELREAARRELASFLRLKRPAIFGRSQLPVLGVAVDANGNAIAHENLITKFYLSRGPSGGVLPQHKAQMTELAAEHGANRIIKPPEKIKIQHRIRKVGQQYWQIITRDDGSKMRVRLKKPPKGFRRGEMQETDPSEAEVVSTPFTVTLYLGNKVKGIYHIQTQEEAAQFIGGMRQRPRTPRTPNPLAHEIKTLRAKLADLPAWSTKAGQLRENLRGLQKKLQFERDMETAKAAESAVGQYRIVVENTAEEKPVFVSARAFKSEKDLGKFIRDVGVAGSIEQVFDANRPAPAASWLSGPVEGPFYLYMNRANGGKVGYYRFQTRQEANGFVRALLAQQGIRGFKAFSPAVKHHIPDPPADLDTQFGARQTPVINPLVTERIAGLAEEGPQYNEDVIKVQNALKSKPTEAFGIQTVEQLNALFTGLPAMDVLRFIQGLTGASDNQMRDRLLEIGATRIWDETGDLIEDNIIPDPEETWESWFEQFSIGDIRMLDPRERTIEDDMGVPIPDGPEFVTLITDALRGIRPPEQRGGEATGGAERPMLSQSGQLIPQGERRRPVQERIDPTTARYVTIKKQPRAGIWRVTAVNGDLLTLEATVPSKTTDAGLPQVVEITSREVLGVPMPSRTLDEDQRQAILHSRFPLPEGDITQIATMSFDEIMTLADAYTGGNPKALAWKIGRNLETHQDLMTLVAAMQVSQEPALEGEDEMQTADRQILYEFWADAIDAAVGSLWNENSRDSEERGLFNDPTYNPPFPDGVMPVTSQDIDSTDPLAPNDYVEKTRRKWKAPSTDLPEPPGMHQSLDEPPPPDFGPGLGAARAGEVNGRKPTTALNALKGSDDFLRDFPGARKFLDAGMYIPFETGELEAAASKIVDEFGGHDAVRLMNFVRVKIKNPDLMSGLGDVFIPFVLMEVADRIRGLSNATNNNLYLRYLDEVQGEVLRYVQQHGSMAGQYLNVFRQLARRFSSHFWVDRVVRKIFEDAKILDKFTPEFRNQLLVATEAMQAAPEGTPKERLMVQRDKMIRDQRGWSLWDQAFSWWYASVLSGTRTHVDNMLMGVNVITESAIMAATNVRSAGKIAQAFMRGLRFGIKRFPSWWKGDFSDRLVDEREAMSERVRDDVWDHGSNALDWMAEHGNWFQKLLSIGRYVQHFMVAVDSTLAHAGYEVRATVNAYRKAMANLTKAQQEAMDKGEPFEITQEMVDKAAEELMALTDADKEHARIQVEDEIRNGHTPESEREIRYLRILQDKRPDEINTSARHWALSVVGNREPYGLAGSIYRSLLALRGGAPVTRPAIPFLRWGANWTNILMDWFPPSALFRVWINSPNNRWYSPEAGGMKTWAATLFDSKFEKLSPVEYSSLKFKTLLGSILMGSIYALFSQYDDDDNPEMQIVGGLYGMSTDRKRQLMNQGIRPYTVRIGNRSFSYRNTPFAALFGAVGVAKDAERYGSEDEALEERLASMFMHGAFMVKDMHVLATLSDLMGALSSGQGNTLGKGEALANVFSRFATGFVSPNLFREVDYWMDATYYDANTITERFQRDVAFMRHLGDQKPVFNVLGEEVRLERYPWSRVYSAPDLDDVWKSMTVKASQGVFMPAIEMGSITDPVTGERRKMTDDELYAYQAAVYQMQGELMRREHTWFRDADPERAQRWLDRQTRRIRERVRSRFGWR